MRKQREILAALLCGIMLTGCAKTPDSPIVREKGSESLKNYKEAQMQNEEQEKETEQADEEKGEEESVNVLADRLQVPNRYQSSSGLEDGAFYMTCDAEVEVPDVDHVSVYKVSQLPFDEQVIGQMTKGFFKDYPVYEGTKYFQMTKEKALKKLEELKGYQAEGNLDPYGYIAAWEESGEDFDEAQVYNLQAEIDGWEEIYESAPEKTEKEQVTPAFGLTPEGQDPAAYADYFVGAVEMDDHVYRYTLQRGTGNHMEIKVSMMDEDEGSRQTGVWGSSFYDQYAASDNDHIPSKDEAMEMAGITREEAIAEADKYMESLGLKDDFEVENADLALSGLTEQSVYTQAGYQVNYTRKVDGFPVTWEDNYGGGLESMESTIEPWGYERVEFVFNKEGLQNAEILNLYQVEEKQVENVEMLSFPEIAGIFEKMLPIKNASGETEKIKMDIKDVRLGYTRIYDPGADNTTGLLVPVWDFFGSREIHTEYEGEAIEYTIGDKSMSHLTVNAVDGTIIDRSLGY